MKNSVAIVAAVLLCCMVSAALGDLYMHNPRGSNDRNCERNENRNNGNRLFDSQNNDKGGYACPRAVGGPEVVTEQMYYFAGSKLSVEWTNQHSCGSNPIVKCDLVLQFACSEYEFDENSGDYLNPYDADHPWHYLNNPWIRDGTPEDSADAATDRMDSGDVNNDRYGYHETYEYYRACDIRRRNLGLWVADQGVSQSGSATRTRQNPNGARRGWECPEERDYYPYWHPTPWKDIAVLTHDTSRCDMFKRESQNRKSKFWCRSKPDPEDPADTNLNGDWMQYNVETECLANGGDWIEVPAWKIPAPECKMSPWSRDNHLGNGKGGMTANYNWTIPNFLKETADRCVFRMRYNISTHETEWDMDARYNGENSPIIQDPFKNVAGHNLSMAVNTNQFGRTFQDRSFVFTIRKRGNQASSGTIHNLNVRGKRGNIVQTYPSVEYDFVPNYLHVAKNDLIHFQWTGSDYNPNREPNNGEGGPRDGDGSQRADRHNIVPVGKTHHIIETDDSSWFGTMSREQMISLAYINQDLTFCETYEELLQDNGNNKDALERDPANCMKLNAARTPYFDLGAVKMTGTGTYTYMSSRNNNFSNRSQKAAIYVKPKLTAAERAGIAVGAITGAALVSVGGGYMWSKRYPNGRVAGAMSKIPYIGGK